MSSVIWSISPRACSTSAGTSSPGSAVVSSRVRRRASGVRSSCETAAVKPGTELLVGSEVALAREVDEPLASSVHLVRDDERDHAALAAQEIGRKMLTLPQPVDRLAGAPARVEDPVRVVEHDDRLPALLDEHPPPDRVGVRHVQRF